jgi:hypothetical protein
MKRENILSIDDAQCSYRNQGKPKRIAANILTTLKVIPDHRSPMHFQHRDLFEEANPKKELDRFIFDHQP